MKNMGVSDNAGYLILGSLQKGSYYLGYYIRVPYFRNLPHGHLGGSGLRHGHRHAERISLAGRAPGTRAGEFFCVEGESVFTKLYKKSRDSEVFTKLFFLTSRDSEVFTKLYKNSGGL